ncbi:MAG TPA: 6-carboxytetrahydropterin synthase [Gemmatimonadaceae bacterium]|nr:6-carboxytetrahydropterin synthase [Gemmatimonadaceae bacterium]
MTRSTPAAATRASLTRRVRFAAAHRYWRPDWSDERNHTVFGACANPHYHGHGYVCDVTVSGEVDPETGMVVDLGVLDRVLRAEVVERFDHRNINREVPEFAEGRLIPTGENLARFIFERVQAALGATATVQRVRVREDEALWAEAVVAPRTS